MLGMKFSLRAALALAAAAHAWMNVVYLTDEEYQAWLKDRTLGATTQQQ